MLVELRAYSHLSPPIHAPLDHASLPFDGFLPPWHHGYIAHDEAFSLVHRHGRVHPVVASPLLEVPSAENPTAYCPLANHLHASPEGPGIAISVDYFGSVPVTPRGNTYILLITDRFSRRADMFAVTAAESTAEGTANILVNKYIPLWACPRVILSDNGLRFCSKLSQSVYQLLGMRKLATSSYHPNGEVERVNHTMASSAGHGRQ